MSRGIDYGLGLTNIDRSNGIRYGVIHQHSVLQSWADSSEPHYGEPTCPVCGNECVDVPEDFDGDNYSEHGCDDHYCETCEHSLDSEDAFGDDPLSFYLDDGEYLAEQSRDDGDIFILKSPFYTRAEFCSPCAPGACYLTSPCDDGERAYCFGEDWFDDDIEPCPYPIWRVDTGELVYTPAEQSDE